MTALLLDTAPLMQGFKDCPPDSAHPCVRHASRARDYAGCRDPAARLVAACDHGVRRARG